MFLNASYLKVIWCTGLTAELEHTEVVHFFYVSYLKVIWCCIQHTAELNMIRSIFRLPVGSIELEPS